MDSLVTLLVARAEIADCRLLIEKVERAAFRQISIQKSAFRISPAGF
jgi:hypothetical protein